MEQFLHEFFSLYDVFYKNASLRNTHVSVGPIILYTRKSKRLIEGKIVSVLDLASLTIDREYQKKGYFTAMINGLLEKYPHDNFFIESVLNSNVRKVGEKFGFKIKYQGAIPEDGYDMYLLR
jgi:hypothetical protein